LDSSIRREVRLHRRVARRIDVPPSSGYVYRSRDWKILSDLLDQEVHRERSGQTVFIILVSEPRVHHGAELYSTDGLLDLLVGKICWAQG
jgi:hypothetical protein